MNKFFSNDPDENYVFLNNQFLKVIDKHIPLEMKNLKGNQAPFVDKQFRKEIYMRSKFRSKYCKNSSQQNEIL